MLSRREICEALSVHGFARDHGLSGAERRVLDALCQGLQANEIAAVQGVAISTVRTQISSIRAKTDSASIGEVVQRLARLPPIRSSLLAEARLERQPLASCR
jgi:DNA-binding CsgD family transcriptional regulator